jgi:hypothetical protein
VIILNDEHTPNNISKTKEQTEEQTEGFRDMDKHLSVGYLQPIIRVLYTFTKEKVL